ncbi:MAG: hypothetical protein OEP48_15055 [Betaproteobacteria bacterium]|nr:hypothetical protein [Betaproteobacteria bacterium]MDH3436392.1 hypothetical protein [Betaproteobacteria bacterium]
MRDRRNEYDVTNIVDTTRPADVSDTVRNIYQDLYQKDAPKNLGQAFADLGLLYEGKYPGFHECETDYHDVQHVLDVTLAMARLLNGCVRSTGTDTVGERLFRFGIITALYHDCGYIRHRKDTKHSNGAEYTTIHVSRGASFLGEYMPRIGMADLAQAAARTLHFTGYEVPVDKIRVPAPEFRLIGNLLGSADILAQMADRCYLEKCYDRLYPEFVLGGIARKRRADGSEQVMFASAADLICKTPHFYQGANKRLRQDLGGCYNYIEKHFGGQNLYFDELEKNIDHARAIAVEGDISMLRRRPPAQGEDEENTDPQLRLI